MAKTAGEAAVLALIYPTAEEDMTSAEREAFTAAAALQDEYMAARKPNASSSDTAGDSSDGSENRRVMAESVGDVRLEYEYTDGGSGGASLSGALYDGNKLLSAAGCVICPEAAALLKCAGLLTRWA